MVLTVLSAAFELFSAMTGIHVRKSHHEKASRGVAVGPVPFGYRREESGGVAEIQSDEAELVLEAFQQRANGASYGQIAARLRDQGARTRKGRMFTAHAVKDILNCKFYAGIVVWEESEFEGQHEAIVTRELFDRVRERRRPRHQSRLVRVAHGLLQGRIACIRCGRPLHSDRSHRGEPMYRERHSLDCDTNNHAR
jgi:site-specific DNA recombinase